MPVAPRRINIELLLGTSATFLSLTALVVSIFQTRIAREQQQASVWPHLQDQYVVMDKKFTWSVINNGIGPAIVKATDPGPGRRCGVRYRDVVGKLCTNEKPVSY